MLMQLYEFLVVISETLNPSLLTSKIRCKTSLELLHVKNDEKLLGWIFVDPHFNPGTSLT